jgi:hypothetical protein
MDTVRIRLRGPLLQQPRDRPEGRRRRASARAAAPTPTEPRRHRHRGPLRRQVPAGHEPLLAGMGSRRRLPTALTFGLGDVTQKGTPTYKAGGTSPFAIFSYIADQHVRRQRHGRHVGIPNSAHWLDTKSRFARNVGLDIPFLQFNEDAVATALKSMEVVGLHRGMDRRARPHRLPAPAVGPARALRARHRRRDQLGVPAQRRQHGDLRRGHPRRRSRHRLRHRAGAARRARARAQQLRQGGRQEHPARQGRRPRVHHRLRQQGQADRQGPQRTRGISVSAGSGCARSRSPRRCWSPRSRPRRTPRACCASTAAWTRADLHDPRLPGAAARLQRCARTASSRARPSTAPATVEQISHTTSRATTAASTRRP